MGIPKASLVKSNRVNFPTLGVDPWLLCFVLGSAFVVPQVEFMIKNTWAFATLGCFLDQVMDRTCVSSIVEVYSSEHSSTLATESPPRFFVHLGSLEQIFVFCAYII